MHSACCCFTVCLLVAVLKRRVFVARSSMTLREAAEGARRVGERKRRERETGRMATAGRAGNENDTSTGTSTERRERRRDEKGTTIRVATSTSEAGAAAEAGPPPRDADATARSHPLLRNNTPRCRLPLNTSAASTTCPGQRNARRWIGNLRRSSTRRNRWRAADLAKFLPMLMPRRRPRWETAAFTTVLKTRQNIQRHRQDKTTNENLKRAARSS